MGMGIDTARDDISAIGVDGFIALEVGTDLLDFFTPSIKTSAWYDRSAVTMVPPLITLLIIILSPLTLFDNFSGLDDSMK